MVRDRSALAAMGGWFGSDRNSLRRPLGLTLGLLASLAQPVAASAQVVQYPNPNNTDRSRYESSNFAIAIATLNIGCGDEQIQLTTTCQDRGTQFGRLLATQLASYPVSAPTGGFSLSFDPRARAYVRASSSFGPSFAERPLTNGRHTLSMGFTSQHTIFDAIDRIGLHTILGQATVLHRSTPTGSATTVALDLSASTMVGFASFGLTDRLDVGLVIPYKRIDFQGQQQTYRSDCAAVVGVMAPGPCIILDFDRPLHRVASGVGDIAARAKYHWLEQERFHAGATLDVSFPTGKAIDFLGTGKVVAKAMLLTSAELGPISPHLNIGYTAGGNSLKSFQSSSIPGFTERSRELNLAAGLETTIGPRFTATADLLGRRLMDIGRLERTSSNVVNAFGLRFENHADQIVGRNLTVSLLNLGFKANVSRTYLVKGDVLIPLNHNGLHSKWTPVFGFDYTF